MRAGGQIEVQKMKRLLFALCLLLVFGLGGCDELTQTQDPSQNTKKPELSEPAAQNGSRRFVPIAPTSGSNPPTIVPWHGFFALDTKTGMLCKTASHDFPNKDEWANQLPLCVGLISASDRPNDSQIKSQLEKEVDKELDKAFGPPKTAEEFIKKHGGEAKSKTGGSNK
jgi:hypothetical protein